MEDRKLSPEYAEEVIELLDIVDSAELAAQIGESTDLTAGTMTDTVVVLDEEDIVSANDDALELTDVVEVTVNEVLDLTELADPSEISEGEPECAEADADAQLIPEVSEAEEKGEEVGTVMVASSEEGSLHQTASVSQAADGGISADIEAVLALVAELDERIGHQEKTQDIRFQNLEEQLAASERRCAELEGRVEELQHQLAESSSMFLGDAGVRLTLEEMVSRMIEARMPSSSDEARTAPEAVLEASVVENEIPERTQDEDAVLTLAEEESEASTDEETVEDNVAVSGSTDEESAAVENSEKPVSQQVIIDTIEELTQHLIELEERVNGWEVRCEQEAALAAARVIREEIAALRAGAARMGR